MRAPVRRQPVAIAVGALLALGLLFAAAPSSARAGCSSHVVHSRLNQPAAIASATLPLLTLDAAAAPAERAPSPGLPCRGPSCTGRSSAPSPASAAPAPEWRHDGGLLPHRTTPVVDATRVPRDGPSAARPLRRVTPIDRPPRG